MSARFVVASVTGYPISPDVQRPKRRPSTAYSVLDSAVCYGIVQQFPAHRTSAKKAQELCDRLNALAGAL
jgi:hypothetical protein